MSEVDGDFGRRLREHRLARGWRQVDLVEAWDGEVARSTLANVESGRERPTPRLWQLITRVAPEWVAVLEPSYRAARGDLPSRSSSPDEADPGAAPEARYELGGPFRLESLQLSYVFRHSRAPEEIIEVRRVRALRNAADGYGLKLTKVETPGFRVDEEVLWGGHLAESQHLDGRGRTVYLRRVAFDRVLRRGQCHEFAVRSWVEKDPEPSTRVQASFTIPVDRLTISLSFLGPERPDWCFAFGPLPDEAYEPEVPPEAERLALSPAGTVSHDFTGMEPGSAYGVGWHWPEG